jgi:hypothetical protein
MMGCELLGLFPALVEAVAKPHRNEGENRLRDGHD